MRKFDNENKKALNFSLIKNNNKVIKIVEVLWVR